ncbi:MAG: addiction module protein [Desulfobacteraceae bacterium]|nr:MAG: addiction module protein [Desulfobacteraceae bacterium]
MGTLAKSDILNLSISERIQLVDDIWDSIAQIPDAIQLSKEQKIELDNRLDAYHRDPNQGEPWDIVLGRIGKRRNA